MMYPTYLYFFIIIIIITKIECWPVFKQDPKFFLKRKECNGGVFQERWWEFAVRFRANKKPRKTGYKFKSNLWGLHVRRERGKSLYQSSFCGHNKREFGEGKDSKESALASEQIGIVTAGTVK